MKVSGDIQKTEEVGVELVVEKQDMEKLEKEEEGKVEKRGRFNVKTDEQKKSEEPQPQPVVVPDQSIAPSSSEPATMKEAPEDKRETEEDKEDEEQNEEEEPKKAVDSSPEGGRYLKYDEEIGRGSFKTVYKGKLALFLRNLRILIFCIRVGHRDRSVCCLV